MGRKRLDPVRNWWSKVAVTPECWLWMAARDRDGYGKFAIGLGGHDQIHTRAHRFAYEAFVEPVPEGMVVCHRCDNPPCVRPDHLFVGTPLDNNNDKVAKGRHARPWGTPLKNRRKTHCKRGHEFTPENTYLSKKGHRSCLTCRRLHSLASYYRKKEST
jgi:hypothetical protein